MRRPDTTTIYAVYWDEDEFGPVGVLKVGREQTDKRHREWERRGAKLAALFVDVPAGWERKAHDALESRFPRAFESERESQWLLRTGYGFTECFIVDPGDRTEALRLVAAAVGAVE